MDFPTAALEVSEDESQRFGDFAEHLQEEEEVQCLNFQRREKQIKAASENSLASFLKFSAIFSLTETTFGNAKTRQKLPAIIATWIFTSCDIPDPKYSTRKICQGLEYLHAVKMHATVAYHFTFTLEFGSEY
ncbi:hypothetical protein RUND412_005812 [Rhizina undulata]